MSESIKTLDSYAGSLTSVDRRRILADHESLESNGFLSQDAPLREHLAHYLRDIRGLPDELDQGNVTGWMNNLAMAAARHEIRHLDHLLEVGSAGIEWHPWFEVGQAINNKVVALFGIEGDSTIEEVTIVDDENDGEPRYLMFDGESLSSDPTAWAWRSEFTEWNDWGEQAIHQGLILVNIRFNDGEVVAFGGFAKPGDPGKPPRFETADGNPFNVAAEPISWHKIEAPS